MAETLASTLNSRIDPFSMASQIASEKEPSRRATMAREVQPELLRQRSEAEREKSEAERATKRKQIEGEIAIEEEFAEGLGRGREQVQAVMQERPERRVEDFDPQAGMELAGMVAILGAMAGSVSGQSALKAMKGITEGYRTGKQDLYERSVKEFEAELEAYKDRIANAKDEYQMSLKEETAKRGAGIARLKIFAPELSDSVAAAHLKVNDIKGYGDAIAAMEKHANDMAAKALEAGIRLREVKPQQILDPDDPGKAILVDLNKYSGLGRRDKGFIGDAVPSAKAATKTAKQQAADETRAEGARKFNILTGQLRNTYTRLQENGEIRDVTQPALQNMFVYLKTTGVGQEIQRMLGYSPQDLRDYTGGLRASLMNAIREATGLGSRSLDSNKELEFYLQAVTDPSATIQSNMRALQDLEAIYGNLKSIADAEGLDDDRVVERAIQAFGAHEPQKYRYSITADNKLERTPRAAAPAQQQPGTTPEIVQQPGESRLEFLRRKRDANALER